MGLSCFVYTFSKKGHEKEKNDKIREEKISE